MGVIDLTNQIFGKLKVLERAENTKDNKAQWLCQCDCGNKRIVVGKYLRNGSVKSCKECARKGINSINLTNKKFGRLTVIESTNEKRGSSIIWKCKCDCGTICYKPSIDLRRGITKSCGCLQKESRQGAKTDLKGQKIGKLIVIEETEQRSYEGVLWNCKCECGNFKLVSTYSLTHKRILSCGCLNSIMNSKIEKILQELNIEYEKEKIFSGCYDKKSLRFDFYLPKYNLCIEYDGIQHFEPISYWKGEEGFYDLKNKDSIKNKYCKDNNILLIRIPYYDKEKINTQYIEELLKFYNKGEENNV